MKIEKRLQQAILKTPTGELRNLLCDLNIEIEKSKNFILLTNEDLIERFKETAPEYISLGMFKETSITMSECHRACCIVYVAGNYANVLKNKFE